MTRDHIGELALIEVSRLQRMALTMKGILEMENLINRDGLTPMQAARLDACLAKRFRYDDGICTMGEDLAARHARGELVAKKVGDGMIDYSRGHFNGLPSDKAQKEYMARLKAKRHYYVECVDGFGRGIPKTVYDAIALPVASGSI